MVADPGEVVVRACPSDEPDVVELLRTHRAWSLGQTPQEFSHSLDAEAVGAAGLALLAARSAGGALLGVVGLKELDPRHGEVKAMHVASAARGTGVGRALLAAVLEECRRRGYARVSLETGTGEAFRPARRLYEAAGFRRCAPFADYADTAWNLCMTLALEEREG